MAAAVNAATMGDAQAADTDNATVTVIDVDGNSIAGRLSELSDTSWKTANRSGATSDLLRIEFGERQAADPQGGPMVLLANGDRLVGLPQSSDGESAATSWARFPGWTAVGIPLETIRAMILDPPESLAERARLHRSIDYRPEGSDALILKNGDRVVGELSGIGENSITLDAAVGQSQVDRASIAAIVFNPEWISFPPVDGPRMLVTLTDGSQITVHHVEMAVAGTLEVDALFGAELEIPVAEIVSIRMLGGRATYLSKLEPASFKHTPYLSGHWDLHQNRNAEGGPLRIGGVEYPLGLGMHSRSEVTYQLDGGYERFQSLVGIDDATAGEGVAVFAVEVDGNRVHESEPIAGGDPPQSVGPIDVSGKTRLTLVVEFGPKGDIQDHADWCDAVLIRKR